MKEGYYQSLERVAKKILKYCTNEETILEKLSKQVKDMNNPQARKLMDTEKTILYEQSKTEDHE